MIPYQQILHFNIGPLTFQSWGSLVALGFIAGMLIIMKEAKRKGFNIDDILNIIVIIFVSSMVGARVFYVLIFLDEFSGDFLSAFKIWDGGMVYYGGFIFAISGFLIYAGVKKMNIWRIFDIGAPALALGLAIGRIGCHLIRDHPGIETNVPWAIMVNGGLRHENGMYLVLLNLVAFLLIWFYFRKKNYPDGVLWIGYLMFEAVGRFFLDFLRAYDLPFSDPRYFASGSFHGLTISQIIAIIMLIAGFYLIPYLFKKSRRRLKIAEGAEDADEGEDDE